MSAEKQYTDVAIVGGGMAGAALALLLSKTLPSLSVVLLEKHTLSIDDQEALVLPSFDARSTALSYSTKKILADIHLWSVLEKNAQAILQVHVSERGQPAGMLMRAEETGLSALGYVIENRVLGHHLLQAIKQQSSITVYDNTVVSRINMTAEAATLTLETAHTPESYLAAKLVVIADGAQSVLRQQLGIAVDEQPYDQHALIANVEIELPHQSVAYERFTDKGPIALLPLQDVMEKHRAALIWTIPDQDIDRVLSLSDEEFLARAQVHLSQRCGRLLSVGARHAYPLSLVQAREQVRSRVVLAGSAAHHLHPVAGQGFNLIMRDCQALVDTLKTAVAAGTDIGALPLLKKYLERQQWDQQKTVTASDWLPRLFSNRYASYQVLRSAALLGLDFLPGVREQFAREATGLSS